MKRTFRAIRWVPCFLTVALLRTGAAGFVGLTVEIDAWDWGYNFFNDGLRKDVSGRIDSSILTSNRVVRCVIGTNTWKIESSFPTFDEIAWFTGTNVIVHTVVTKESPIPARLAETTKLAVSAPSAGHRYTRVHESADGNLGRPGGVEDLFGFNLSGHIAWLAFCSAPALKTEGRRIYPPSAMWKESAIYYSGWKDSTEVFQDGLRLPKSINLVSTNGQTVFQYQVHQTTNVFGWEIPTEFYGVQYLPSATNGWRVHLTFKGKVTAIAPAAKPEIPEVVMQVIQR